MGDIIFGMETEKALRSGIPIHCFALRWISVTVFCHLGRIVMPAIRFRATSVTSVSIALPPAKSTFRLDLRLAGVAESCWNCGFGRRNGSLEKHRPWPRFQLSVLTQHRQNWVRVRVRFRVGPNPNQSNTVTENQPAPSPLGPGRWMPLPASRRPVAPSTGPVLTTQRGGGQTLGDQKGCWLGESCRCTRLLDWTPHPEQASF